MESSLSWLPVKSMIHDHQQACYDAINASNEADESTAFIEFILAAIKASLIEAINVSDVMSDETTGKPELRWKKIETFLQPHDYVMNADVLGLCGVSLSQQIGFWRDARPTKSSKSVVQVVIGDTERRSDSSFVHFLRYVLYQLYAVRSAADISNNGKLNN